MSRGGKVFINNTLGFNALQGSRKESFILLSKFCQKVFLDKKQGEINGISKKGKHLYSAQARTAAFLFSAV